MAILMISTESMSSRPQKLPIHGSTIWEMKAFLASYPIPQAVIVFTGCPSERVTDTVTTISLLGPAVATSISPTVAMFNTADVGSELMPMNAHDRIYKDMRKKNGSICEPAFIPLKFLRSTPAYH